MGNIYINLKKLVFNTGQIEGVPRNPREWTKEDVSRLAASIVETPEREIVAQLGKTGNDE